MFKSKCRFLKNSYIKTIAMSHTETFDKSSDAVIELETLFEEAADQEKIIINPYVLNLQRKKHLNMGFISYLPKIVIINHI